MVHGLDAWWDMKQAGAARPKADYIPIHMPHYTGSGVVLAGLSTIFGLAMIWYIWWLAVLSFVGIVGYAIWHTFNYDRDYYVPAEEVRETEEARDRALAAQGA